MSYFRRKPIGMHWIVRNTLAFLAGIIIGWGVNMGLIMLGMSIVPPPARADTTTPEGLEAALPLMTGRHFVFPFLAHALGTFFGALTAALLAARHKMNIALGMGIFFLAGGLVAAFLIPAPSWFIAVDLLFAYAPMAYLAGMIVRPRKV